jgi:hypothetical protein
MNLENEEIELKNEEEKISLKYGNEFHFTALNL